MTSFTTTHFQTLLAYHWHTNQRLLDAAARVEETALQSDAGYGRGSIHNVFVHLLNTDRSYRVALQTGQRPPPLDPATLPDLPGLRGGFAEEQAAWDALLGRLAAEEIETPMTVSMRAGANFPIPRWHLLQQVILHGMQHHTELAQALTEKGQSPGDLDFILFV